MADFFSFLGTILQLLVLGVVILAVVALIGYNRLRSLSEIIREAWSNIGVMSKKQVSLVNQLIEVVKGYQESEKLVMLKVSDDSTAASVAKLHEQSSLVLSTVSGLVQRFPELKANEQYQRLIDSIQDCEAQLETARLIYNESVRTYNTQRSSIPHVFYATTIGFKVAPYLEFNGNEQVGDMGLLKTFSSDDDGERLQALLGAASSSAKKIASKALEGGKTFVDSAQEKVKQLADERANRAANLPPIPPPKAPDPPRYHYLDKDRKPMGPVPLNELQRLLSAADINGETLVLPTGGIEWISYEQLFSTNPSAPSAPISTGQASGAH